MDSFADFIKSFPLHTYQKGELLPLSTDSGLVLSAIQHGYVKVVSYDINGSQQFIHLIGRLDIVPTKGLFELREDNQYFYEALTSVSAYTIDKSAFLRFIRENSDVAREIARAMSDHYDALLSRLQATEQSTVRSKLLYTLLQLGSYVSAETIVSLDAHGLALTQTDLAQMIGTTRETTALELQKLKHEDIIDFQRKKITINMKKARAQL